MISFTINNNKVSLDIEADTPLLWVIRDELNLTATKYGCGAGLCGCCTVHLDGKPIRSCITPVSSIDGKSITTLEGLGNPDRPHPLHQAWIKHNVPQCGYCQPGQMMTAAGLLSENPNPSDDEIREYMAGNLCRCGTYSRIHAAIKDAAKLAKDVG